MIKIPDLVNKKIHLFIDELERNNIHIQKAILFGSFALGTANEWSDIDLALVSDRFTGDRFDDREMIREYKAVAGWDISPYPYTPADFDASFFVRDEILEKGLVIR
jgi:predicted nucleotidyltransferase